MFNPNHYFGECLLKQSDNVIIFFVFYRDPAIISPFCAHFFQVVYGGNSAAQGAFVSPLGLLA